MSTIKLIAGRDLNVHVFPKDISPKVNVIAQLEFELTYYDNTVQNISHYAMRTPYQLFLHQLDKSSSP